MVDLIDRQAVQEMVDRIGDIHPYRQIGNRESYSQYNEAWTDAINRVDAELNSLPSANIDLSGFSDRLWRAAYERGKAEPVRQTAEWIYGEKDGADGWYCSKCGFHIPWYYEYYGLNNINFIRDFHTCPHCDSKMMKYTGMDEVAQ